MLGPLPESDLWQKTLSVAQRLPHQPKCIPVITQGSEQCFDALLDLYSAAELEPELRPKSDDVAAYFHTGGTTGLPKLACHSHANQVAAARAYMHSMDCGPGDVTLNGLPIFHVAGALVNSLGGLCSGVQMLLPTLGGFRNPEVIRQHWRLVEH